MKKIRTLILVTLVTLMATSCGMYFPESGYGYGHRYDHRYGNGNRYGNGLRKGMPMDEVLRMYGRPYDSRSYNKGRNRIDILYYREAVRSGGRVYYSNTQMEFKNGYLHKVKRNNKNASNGRMYDDERRYKKGYKGNKAYRRY